MVMPSATAKIVLKDAQHQWSPTLFIAADCSMFLGSGSRKFSPPGKLGKVYAFHMINFVTMIFSCNPVLIDLWTSASPESNGQIPLPYMIL